MFTLPSFKKNLKDTKKKEKEKKYQKNGDWKINKKGFK